MQFFTPEHFSRKKAGFCWYVQWRKSHFFLYNKNINITFLCTTGPWFTGTSCALFHFWHLPSPRDHCALGFFCWGLLFSWGLFFSHGFLFFTSFLCCPVRIHFFIQEVCSLASFKPVVFHFFVKILCRLRLLLLASSAPATSASASSTTSTPASASSSAPAALVLVLVLVPLLHLLLVTSSTASSSATSSPATKSLLHLTIVLLSLLHLSTLWSSSSHLTSSPASPSPSSSASSHWLPCSPHHLFGALCIHPLSPGLYPKAQRDRDQVGRFTNRIFSDREKYFRNLSLKYQLNF